jgi:hypothetical protein
MTEDLDLLRSHDELRAALLLAGKEIRKLNFGRKDSDVLKMLRRVLREARTVAKAERERRGLKSGLPRKQSITPQR